MTPLSHDSDTKIIWQIELIWQVVNLPDGYQTYLIPNLSDTETNFDTKPIRYQTKPIRYRTNTKPIRYGTNQNRFTRYQTSQLRY
jgi:hypothetical protein